MPSTQSSPSPARAPWPRWELRLPDELRPPTEVDRFLLWLARRQWRSLAAGALFGTLWMLPVALAPAAIGQAIDAGVVARDGSALLLWSGAVLLLGIVSGLAGNGRHLAAVTNWLLATFRGGTLADRALRRAGPALTREMPVGEIVTSFSSDFGRLGGAYDVFARMTGSIVSFVVVAVILLRGSPLLGLIMLGGGPLLVLSLSLVMKPLQRRQETQRGEAGRLNSLGADTVAGLRVLRGIGGEETFLVRYAAQSDRVRVAGVRLAGLQATLDAAQVLLPGVFVLVVTAIGSRLVLRGEITPGQLVAFYGYTAFLTTPLRTAVEFAESFIRARVAARRIVRILAAEPDHAGQDAPGSAALGPAALDSSPAGALVDPASGVRAQPGRVTAIVSAEPEESAAIAHRLGRIGPGSFGVRWGESVLDDLPIAEVRRRIVVSEPSPHLFSGSVRAELLAGADHAADESAGRLARALDLADARDVFEAIEGGLDGVLQERGRTLSGGQRQRLALARALVRDPEVLVLIEPTSAVDAHTEARIARRLHEQRRGRTTVLVTASPLLLATADEVLLVESGEVTDQGTHHDLLRRSTAYRDIVLRGGED